MTCPGNTGPPVYYIGNQTGRNAVYPMENVAVVTPPCTLQPAVMQTSLPGPALCFPPGLDCLSQFNQFLVHQRVQLDEIIIGWEMNNAYTVTTTQGQQVFATIEENDLFTAQACGPNRPFTIRLHDNLGREIITLTRPMRCTMCCFPFCLQELEVQSPHGHPIGYVEQNWHPLLPKFTILNETRMPQLKIVGPSCDCNCMSDTTFEVTSLDESAVIGQISKQWSDFIQESFTDADNFVVSFPMELDVKTKAVILGACFLIDFMFYENKPRRN
ncbi:phospholipid scramblase 1-like isoform X2 [Corythoichthys intestinalis]|nr:phospholipid scramblase 1-like isoform X2 [Corythoichthys intestinalis]XP_061797053.1 phospholipid scramblase 1-like [Nerophis lumbriciformis]